MRDGGAARPDVADPADPADAADAAGAAGQIPFTAAALAGAATAAPGGDRSVAASRVQALRERHGMRGEALAAAHLEHLGWRVLARRVRVGRDEIDLVAIEPGKPPTLVIVEVRNRATTRFGSAAESVDRRKVARLYRAALGLRHSGQLPDGSPVPPLHWRVDLIAIDDAPAIGPGAGGPAIRHIRALEPG